MTAPEQLYWRPARARHAVQELQLQHALLAGNEKLHCRRNGVVKSSASYCNDYTNSKFWKVVHHSNVSVLLQCLSSDECQLQVLDDCSQYCKQHVHMQACMRDGCWRLTRREGGDRSSRHATSSLPKKLTLSAPAVSSQCTTRSKTSTRVGD